VPDPQSPATGISVNDTTLGTTVATLGMTDVRFPRPVFHGDTLRVKTEVMAKRESRSRADAGIVEFHHSAFNQQGELVAECRRQAFMRKVTVFPADSEKNSPRRASATPMRSLSILKIPPCSRKSPPCASRHGFTARWHFATKTSVGRGRAPALADPASCGRAERRSNRLNANYHHRDREAR
jgi:MaoC like domain